MMIGTTIGPYEIRSALGAGGMGEVYRARDSKLGRDVALKVLPQALALDADRVARFRREAQVLASLNHANIGTIHGLEELDGVPVLVLELVEGPTLADRLVHGPVPIDEAFAIARQMAEALEAAHEHGIVHRDLKPANVKLRPDGVVKVLDFGLAKALDGPPEAGHYAGDRSVRLQPDLTRSPTITSPAMTRIGVILGTASYMSPEQARGLAVDRGADIWAWGCVLFEMLAGRRAFDGADTTDVIAAVIRGEPDWSHLPSDAPASVRRLLRRCLEKDPRRRLADIRDARFTLEDLGKEPDTVAAALVHPYRERFLWAAALLACIAASTALFWRAGTLAPAAREMRVEITTPPTTDLVSIGLSPDGERLAYVASSDGRQMLWLRSLATGEAQALTGTDGASFPFWSPDSRSIGYFAAGRLHRIDADGGSPKEITPAAVGSGGTWSSQGVILYTGVPDAPISQVSDSGGPVTLVPGSTPGKGGNRFPQFLPDGRHYLYFVAEPDVRGVYLGTLDGPERRRLLHADAAAVFAPPARILFVRAGTLFTQRFDPAILMLDGEPVSVATGVAVDNVGAAAVSGSSVGTIVYRVGSSNRQRQLVWFDRSGAPLGEPFPVDSMGPLNHDFSPDELQLVMNRTLGGNADIWTLDLERRGAFTRLTTASTPDISPVWSPDGSRIVYSGRQKDGFDLAEIPATGTGRESVVFSGPVAEVPLDWSRDGRHVLFRSQFDPKTSVDIWALPMQGERTPFPVAQTVADEGVGSFSPDGRWVAFESNESGRYEIYVQSFPTAAARPIVSTGGGLQPRWAPDGKEIYYIAPDGRLMSVQLRFSPDGRTVAPAPPVPLFLARVSTTSVGGSRHEYLVARDGKRFLMNTLVAQVGAPITLILNAAAAKP
jgi:Tol biopolymer transport system component